jgi:hypothetical protein
MLLLLLLLPMHQENGHVLLDSLRQLLILSVAFGDFLFIYVLSKFSESYLK